MKNNTKMSAQKYLLRRGSFQSQQFSAVIEVNPSCQSQQSMFQKTNFPGQEEQKNINNCDSKLYKKGALTERNFNDYEFRKNRVSNNNDQNILKHYESQQYSSLNKRTAYQSSRQIKYDNCYQKPSNNDFKRQNYQTQEQFYQSDRQRYCQSNSLIDEEKLKKIQLKIKNHQMKQYNNKQNQLMYSARKRSLHDTMEKQLSKIQIYDSQIKMRKKPTIIDQIKDQKSIINKENINRQRTKNYQNETFIDRFTKNSEKCLSTIFNLVLTDQSQKLSPSNINIKNSVKEEIKLVLGPIFADVIIKGKSISKAQFIQKAHQLLKSYRDQQIEAIFFSIVNGFTKTLKEYDNFSSIHQIKSVELARAPGKLLKNSKTGYETKQKQRNQENITRQNRYFQNIQTSSDYICTKSKDFNIPEKFSKKAYIQQTEKTEPEESCQTAQQNFFQRYETKINLNHQALQIMLNQEKSKRKSSTLENKENYQIKSLKNDDQLIRLNNLEKKFNEHFKTAVDA